jgi:hypothetical protein
VFSEMLVIFRCIFNIETKRFIKFLCEIILVVLFSVAVRGQVVVMFCKFESLLNP